MNIEHDYRPIARAALERSRQELESGEDARVRYAALELRMAIEALTYERAHAFREMLPLDAAVRHWQPPKLLKQLVKIDPQSDQTRTLYVLAETGEGKEKEVLTVGTENVLSLRTVKANYDALGHHLHLPTIAQLESGEGHDMVALRRRCESLAADVEKALSSNMFNMVFGRDLKIDCARCGTAFSVKLPWEELSQVVECRNCSAPYHVRSREGEEVEYRGLRAPVKCQAKGCSGSHELWDDQIKAGTTWACATCGTKHSVDLCVRCPEAPGWDKVEARVGT